MDLDALTPVSGVKNCHCEGLFSLMFEDGLRLYATTEWTPLAANSYGDVVGFHNHHVDIQLKVILGEIENISPQMEHREQRSAGYSIWEWNSPLRERVGHFSQLPVEVVDKVKSGAWKEEDVKVWLTPDVYVSDCAFRTKLHPDSSTLELDRYEVHTVNQLTRNTAWFVKEYGPSTGLPTYTWSTHDLSDWHSRGDDFYVPMSQREVSLLWKKIKGAVKNA